MPMREGNNTVPNASGGPTHPHVPSASDAGTPAKPVAVPIASQVEGYQILGKLGEGGMGMVWRAIQLSTKREVALKLISPAFDGSEKMRSRFEREVELAASRSCRERL